MWKWLVGIFLACIVVCGVGGYFASSSPAVKGMIARYSGREKSTQVRLDTAVKGDLVRTVSAPGQIDPKVKVEIVAQVSARITALPFKEGDEVKEGDVVVRLDAEELAAALQAQRAGLKADEARLEGLQAAMAQSSLDRDRARQLYESKDRSKSDLEVAEVAYLQAQSSLRVGEASIEIARANIRRAERDVQNTVISSPIDGTIIRLNNEVGETVLGTFNNAGQVIMEIADLDVMLMRAEIDESSIASVAKSQRAKVYVNAYPGRTFTGVVDQIKQQRQIARDGKGYFETEVIVDRPDDARLLAGLTANADVQVETQYGVIKVPSQCVLDRRVEELPGDAQKQIDTSQKTKAFTRVVYRIIDGKAVASPVVTGTSDLTSTVILSGIVEGDRIISGPYKVLAALRDGQLVEELASGGPVPAGPAVVPASTDEDPPRPEDD